MRYVILRDDDTNALTPVDYLERLYRPFLDKKLPVNLAVIPCVNTQAKKSNGDREEFLFAMKNTDPVVVPIGYNKELVQYLQKNSGYCLAQHGFYHDYNEFISQDSAEIGRRLDQGIKYFIEAGFARPKTFIAPHDVISKNALSEIAKRFSIVSKNWYEIQDLPYSLWPGYLLKKIQRTNHWKSGDTIFLTRTRQYLADDVPVEIMLDGIKKSIQERELTIVLTHWWSFYKKPEKTTSFIAVLAELADYLANDPEIRVISFDDLLNGSIPLS